VAKGLAAKAVDDGAFAVFGPVFSGSIMVSMAETRRAEIPNWTGGEAAAITAQGNPYVFRTAFGQASSFPKLAKYIQGKAKTLAVIYQNNDFGKGGRDTLVKLLATGPTKIISEVATDQGQVDFSAAVLKAKQANADALFVYLTEEESARALRELRKQGYDKPIIGETVLISQKVIELAGDAANGATGHVGLTVDAPSPEMLAFKGKFYQAYKYIPDHNGIKGYMGRGAGDEGPGDQEVQVPGHHHGRALRRQGRHRPRELPGRGQGRPPGRDGNAAAARSDQVTSPSGVGGAR
jgi:branched-chain amino acid transport system substrate-binding protein